MKENVVQIKSYAFAIKIVNVCKQLQDERREFILSKQLLRSGTSIGANIEEAIGAQSKKDFFAKLTISYEEARETKYWIRLLTDTEYLTKEESEPLINEIEELLRIIGSIQKAIRNS
mgnify:CR=1 FL=1